MYIEDHEKMIHTLDDALDLLCPVWGDGTVRYVHKFDDSIVVEHYGGGYYSHIKTDRYRLHSAVLDQLLVGKHIALPESWDSRPHWQLQMTDDGKERYWKKINDQKRQDEFDKRAFFAVQT